MFAILMFAVLACGPADTPGVVSTTPRPEQVMAAHTREAVAKALAARQDVISVRQDRLLREVLDGLAELSPPRKEITTIPGGTLQWALRAQKVDDFFYEAVFTGDEGYRLSKYIGFTTAYTRWSREFADFKIREFPNVIARLNTPADQRCYTVRFGVPVRVPRLWMYRSIITVRNPDGITDISGIMVQPKTYQYGERCDVDADGRVVPLGQVGENVLVRYEPEEDRLGCPAGTLFFISVYDYPAFVGATENFGVPTTPEERAGHAQDMRDAVDQILASQ